MKTKKIFILLVSVFLWLHETVLCQFEFQDSDPTGTILPALQSQVRSQYGSQFEVYYAVLDSMIGNTPIADVQGAITDPFGTLKGTIFFWAAPDKRDPENRDSVVVGMSKNGQVIWMTPPVYKGGVIQIYASCDLNKDGEVDLITLWSSSYMYDFYSKKIVIISWNGSTGRLISDIDPETQEPKMTTTGSTLELIQRGNGVYDLRAYWSNAEDMKDYFPTDSISTRPWVVYSWNGTKYVLNKKAK